jgi:hypothetical protein
MPNDDDGPPTLVLPVPPDPKPGLNRRPTLDPGNMMPYASSCDSEHALTFRPFSTSSAKKSGNSWVDNEI